MLPYYQEDPLPNPLTPTGAIWVVKLSQAISS